MRIWLQASSGSVATVPRQLCRQALQLQRSRLIAHISVVWSRGPVCTCQAPALQCPELEELEAPQSHPTGSGLRMLNTSLALEVPIFLVSPTGRCPVVLCSYCFAKMLGCFGPFRSRPWSKLRGQEGVMGR